MSRGVWVVVWVLMLAAWVFGAWKALKCLVGAVRDANGSDRFLVVEVPVEVEHEAAAKG